MTPTTAKAPRGRPKGSYRARIQLPSGEVVMGWDVAAARLGRKSVPALAAHADYDAERGVHVLPADLPRRGPAPVTRIRLPGGEIVTGWREAAQRLGYRSVAALRARAEEGEDGVYTVTPGNRAARFVSADAIRAAIVAALAAGCTTHASVVRVVRGQLPHAGRERIRALTREITGAGHYAKQLPPWRGGV